MPKNKKGVLARRRKVRPVTGNVQIDIEQDEIKRRKWWKKLKQRRYDKSYTKLAQVQIKPGLLFNLQDYNSIHLLEKKLVEMDALAIVLFWSPASPVVVYHDKTRFKYTEFLIPRKRLTETELARVASTVWPTEGPWNIPTRVWTIGQAHVEIQQAPVQGVEKTLEAVKNDTETDALFYNISVYDVGIPIHTCPFCGHLLFSKVDYYCETSDSYFLFYCGHCNGALSNEPDFLDLRREPAPTRPLEHYQVQNRNDRITQTRNLYVEIVAPILDMPSPLVQLILSYLLFVVPREVPKEEEEKKHEKRLWI